MKQSRFTEEQIIGILREQESGIAVKELCRKHGVSSPTFYKWKAKFGGMDVSEARKLRSNPAVWAALPGWCEGLMLRS